MSATALLVDLRARGLRLRRHGPALEVAPQTALTVPDRAALRAHQGEVLTLLDVEALEQDCTAAQLRAVAGTLTPAEHRRLVAEATAGDRLALLMRAVLASSPPREEP
jgi:hypothetical protein